MQIHYTLSFQDYPAALALNARKNAFIFICRLLGFYGFSIFGLLLLASLPWSRAGANHWAGFDWTNVVFDTFLIAMPLFFRCVYWWQYRRTVSRSGVITLSLDPELIRCQSEHTKSEIEWAAIKRFAENKKSFLLYLMPGKFLIVPKRICSARQIDELRALFQASITAKK